MPGQHVQPTLASKLDVNGPLYKKHLSEHLPTSEPTFPWRTATSIAISATSRSGVSTGETTASAISVKSDSLTEARLLLMYKSSTALVMLCMLDSLALRMKRWSLSQLTLWVFFFFFFFSSVFAKREKKNQHDHPLVFFFFFILTIHYQQVSRNELFSVAKKMASSIGYIVL